jgi:hypothetical protein
VRGRGVWTLLPLGLYLFFTAVAAVALVDNASIASILEIPVCVILPFIPIMAVRCCLFPQRLA